MTIGELGALLRARKVSCRELIQQTLADIRKRDRFNSFITITEDEALKEADDRDAELASGTDRGPFHGIPIGHKDLFYTQGVRTTAGSLVFRDFVPEYDGTVVRNLREAGAISIGKTNLHELAYGITSQNPHYGPVLNPHDTERIPGGSSGGSAALVAAGLLPMCLGTDTGGSIRIPASYCGITGIKPTYGRVSRYGILPLAYSLDHAGPLTSCVQDCALTLNAIAGFDANDPSSARVETEDFVSEPLPDLGSVRVGLPSGFFDELEASVLQRVTEAIERMRASGAKVNEVRVPDLAAMNAGARVVQLAETAALYIDRRNPAEFSAATWALLEQGRMIAGHEYVNAQRLRTMFLRQFERVWAEADVLVTATTPVTAPRRDETTVEIGGKVEDARMASTRLVRSINYLGFPAVSMPCGSGANGMPVGLQLIAQPFAEKRLLQVARMVEGLLRGA